MQTQQIDHEWRRWIAENLLLDGDPHSILQAMLANGIAADEAQRELAAAQQSPYLAGAARLQSRLKKQAWPLDIYRKLNRLDPRMAEVPRRLQLSGELFFREYYALNRPVILTGMLDDWPALHGWHNDYLRRWAEREVEVQFGRSQDANYEVNQPQLRRTMRFGDYLALIEAQPQSNDFYMTANNSSQNRQALRELWEDIGPLADYLDGQAGQGFLWFGPAGTKTPLHHDLTNNFMAQLRGRKLVRLVPAVELGQLYNDLHCYSQLDASALDLQRFPKAAQAQWLDVVLAPAEILFLPVGCWHYVEALDVSITLSFTNFRWDNDFSSFYSTYHGV